MAQAATLSWGVKQSFRTYVGAVGGTTEVGGGAEPAADGGFVFAAAPDGGGLRLGADGRLEGRGRFLGEVRFEGHGGMLKVFLADPILDIDGEGASLTVADTVSRKYRVEVARLDLAAMSRTADGEIVIPAALAMDGIQLLGDHYPLKTALDPVRLRLG